MAGAARNAESPDSFTDNQLSERLYVRLIEDVSNHHPLRRR
jgi:hypothetical protein